MQLSIVDERLIELFNQYQWIRPTVCGVVGLLGIVIEIWLWSKD